MTASVKHIPNRTDVLALRSVAPQRFRNSALLTCAAIAFTCGQAAAQSVHLVPAQFTTIQDAINAATAGDTVRVGPGIYTEAITFTGVPITLESEQGAAVTRIHASPIAPGPVVSVISGEPAGTRIQGFTIRNGTGTPFGGGILVLGSQLEIHDCLIQNNTADLGGGLYVEGVAGGITQTIVTVTDTIFLNNGAAIGGGAAYIGQEAEATFTQTGFQGNAAFGDGGAVHIHHAIGVAFDDCHFLQNMAGIGGSGSGSGGAIHAWQYGSLDIQWSEFKWNDAGTGAGSDERGGGLDAASWLGPLEVRDSLFEGNNASRGGGAYVGDSSTAVFLRVEFEENEAYEFGGGAAVRYAQSVVFDDCLVIDNEALTTGGGIHLEEGDMVLTALVTDSTILWNHAGSFGGGLRAIGSAMNLHIHATTVVQNSTNASGAGAAIQIESQPPLISDSHFMGNLAEIHGGALYNIRAGAIVTDTHIEENLAIGGTWSQGGGAALANQTSPALFQNCFIAGNNAEDGAGFAAQKDAWVNFVNCQFLVNHGGSVSLTSGRGGGGYIAPNVKSVTIDASYFSFNHTELAGQGGGLYNESLPITPITNTVFEDNMSGKGGGIANTGLLQVFESAFLNNSTRDLTNTHFMAGGGIYQRQEPFAPSSLLIQDTLFEGNATESNFKTLGSGTGGGIHHDSGVTTILGCTFRANEARLNGGGLYIGSSIGSVFADRNEFYENLSDIGRGGAIAMRNAKPVIANSLFIGNVTGATLYGGGVYAEASTPLIINSTFYNDIVAVPPGGVPNGQSVSAVNSTVQLFNSIVWADPPIANVVWGDAGSFVDVRHSCVLFGFAGQGNMSADPLFVDAFGGDLRLQPVSPAVDVGNNGFLMATLTLDLDGNPRIQGAAVDMGAYEHGATCPWNLTGSGTVGVADLLFLLSCWGPVTAGTPCAAANFTGSGSVGVADLLILLANWGPCP